MARRDLALRRNGRPEPDEPPALTPVQLQAVASLAGGVSLAEVARAAGVDVRTLYEWRRTPEFLAELNRLRIEARDRASAEVRALATQAVATIRTVMTSAETPAGLRLKAAFAVLRSVGAERFGSDDPEVVRRELEEEQFEAENPMQAMIGRALGDPAARRR